MGSMVTGLPVSGTLPSVGGVLGSTASGILMELSALTEEIHGTKDPTLNLKSKTEGLLVEETRSKQLSTPAKRTVYGDLLR